MRPKEAFCLIRPEPQYRRDAFVNGLTRAGYAVREQYAPGGPNRVLVIWNRYGGMHDLALKFEREGGRVIVAENGYLGNDRFNRTRYAIALHAHNGQGKWHVGEEDRFSKLGIVMQPERTSGEHILLCPSRCFGRPGHIMPVNWAEAVSAQLRKHTRRPLKIRLHPGENRPKVALADDLRNCWAVVVWYSSLGCDALAAGIPVFSCAPNWVAQSAACRDLALIETPPQMDRAKALNEVAWAQWHIEEIARGEPFQHLLH